jgi:hypothetical protein
VHFHLATRSKSAGTLSRLVGRSSADVASGLVHGAGDGLGEYNETCPITRVRPFPTQAEGRIQA